MKRVQYTRLLRGLAGATALALWVISMTFSVDGFGFELPGYAWIGLIMGLAVTVLELVYNREGMRHNLTLRLAGVAAYSYGFYTNFVGLLLAMGNNLTTVFTE